MTGLLNLLRDQIAERGPITIAEYMDMALLHPKFGYYRHGDPLGAKGDFITSPEISQMFGEMIGLWWANVWQSMGRPTALALLELGPGRGTLMEDALRATAKIPAFHQAIELLLLESNDTLREKQREKLSKFNPRFIDDLSQLPAKPLLAVANEFFDALPVRQFERTFQGWCEKLVTFHDDQLTFTPWPLDESLSALIPESLRDAPPGSVYEISFPSASIVRDLARHLVEHSGAALILDYGYAVPSGDATLQAVSDHQFTAFLHNPGGVDLTAHVDFSMLSHVARAQGVNVFGPMGQGEFLNSLGIHVRASQLQHRASPAQIETIQSALYRLTDPTQMGSLFKTLGLASKNCQHLLGFP